MHLRSAAITAIVLAFASSANAESNPDSLRLVPKQANLIVQAPRPTQLIDAYSSFELLKDALALEPLRELGDSTNMRRFRRLVAYFEKQLGAKWPEAVEKLAGGGVTLAARVSGENPPPALLVIQGTDAALVRKFADLGLAIIEQDLAREESKETLRRDKYRDLDTAHVGKDFHVAVVDAAILVSNRQEPLHKAIDLHRDGPKESLAADPNVSEARKLLEPAAPARGSAQSLAWIWFNLDLAHQSPQAKDIFKLPRNEAGLTVLFGGMLDVIGRSPYVCAALSREKNDVTLSVRMPAGRDGMPAALSVHVPRKNENGTLPPLQLKSTLFSTSFYLDVSQFWEQRAKLFNAAQVKGLEDGDKKTAFFLLGNRFSKIAADTGPYHRVVVVNQPKGGYEKQPEQHVPAFAWVMSLREPEKFEKKTAAVLRAAGFLVSTQVKLKLAEEKRGGYTIVGYRFDDKEPLKGDNGYLRYNYSPAFVRVGDQFVVSSTIELARELVDVLTLEDVGWKSKEVADGEVEVQRLVKEQDGVIKKLTAASADRPALIEELARLEGQRKELVAKLSQARTKALANRPGAGSAKEKTRFYADGMVDAFRVNEETLIAQSILNQALTPEAAKKQVEVFIDLVRRLGVLQTETHYGDKDFRVDLRLKMRTK